jgi:hypothetical protein
MKEICKTNKEETKKNKPSLIDKWLNKKPRQVSNAHPWKGRIAPRKKEEDTFGIC